MPIQGRLWKLIIYKLDKRETLNLEEGKDKLIFWRRVIYVLKCMKLQNKDLFDHRIGAVDSSAVATSEDLATRQVHTYPVPDEEARIRGREAEKSKTCLKFLISSFLGLTILILILIEQLWQQTS